ncbi:multidrug ABC transporter substrate-binding protein [Candidatus Nitrosoglobus terrae]|uniref:Multidrug ABC transporter substrate-binding protein n=1 Tax=Candidatus Nitrosoglobus terrae TaxID=1630141 RepID=A0A1Q2SLF1_9GAMM|nr:ABC transporter permease [Candidatus Nitrosoglobus terrae]BAW79958.1 multidrug ABC transporter substrate-binding protein [Candidatus Nitrosoglobus terrae]
MWWNAFLLAWREIRRNLMRSFLTILGIVIGVAAVITMVTLGSGATARITEQIASLGSNLLIIRPGQRMGPGLSSVAPPFSLRDSEAIAREIDTIAAVAPSASYPLTAIFGNTNWSTTVTGIDSHYFTVRNQTIEIGRAFLDSELRAGKALCILGATVKEKLFGDQNPIGSHIRLQKISCQVMGLLEAKGQSMMGSDQDDIILIPLRTLQRRIAGNQDIPLIQVSVQEKVSTLKAQRDIEQLLRKRRHITPSKENNFSVRDMKEITKMLTGTTQVMTTLLGAVAAVSLLVGGIGIMNIMLVSVTERTREIGIRLAIGALEREVLLQFLIEAVVLSSFGGLMGILLALIASLGLSSVLQVPFILKPSIVILAFLFSAAVGVVFGYFPAKKAARLDPIEALRYE